MTLAPTVALAQVPIPSPPPITTGGGSREPPPVGAREFYGPAEPVELDQIANGGSYQKRNVVVKTRVEDLVPGRYLGLTDGVSRVMLILFYGSDYHDVSKFIGIEVEVTGVVRRIPANQKRMPCFGGSNLESKCEDPLLPELPDAQPNWPAQSLTLLTISDRGKELPRKGTRTLADTGLDAAAADGKAVRALGQFRGANLCKDLPEASRHDPEDWVLHTSEGPVWVTGRRPAGQGFHLDATYRGDTTRWLEVRGKVLILDNVRYLKATRVSLIPRPPEAEPEPCPP